MCPKENEGLGVRFSWGRTSKIAGDMETCFVFFWDCG